MRCSPSAAKAWSGLGLGLGFGFGLGFGLGLGRLLLEVCALGAQLRLERRNALGGGCALGVGALQLLRQLLPLALKPLHVGAEPRPLGEQRLG